jgi:protein SCO1/2
VNCPRTVRTRGLILLLALASCLLLASCSRTPALGGTSLGMTPAPDFTLTDAANQQFSLHDYRGRVVVLTFLYTNCPDICPAIAGNLASVAHQLGSNASKFAFIAVSVDPVNDTPESVRTFTQDHDLGWLGDGWRYGLGRAAELAAVWSSYGIGAEPLPAAASSPRLAALGFSEIDHNAVLYLIDRQGRERTVLHYDVSVAQLTADLKALARN